MQNKSSSIMTGVSHSTTTTICEAEGDAAPDTMTDSERFLLETSFEFDILIARTDEETLEEFRGRVIQELKEKTHEILERIQDLETLEIDDPGEENDQ